MPDKVTPETKSSTYDIELRDGSSVWKMALRGGERGLVERGNVPQTTQFSGGGKRFGRWEPAFSHIQQRSWHGGRGQENFEDDETRFFDSQDLYTLIPSCAFPAPKWKFAEGLRSADTYFVDDVGWRALEGATRYISVFFTASASYSATQCGLWIRRVGSPATLTFVLCSDNVGDPGTTLQTATKTTADITDWVSLFALFNITAQSLVSGTTYHLYIYGASDSNKGSHWEIGVDPGVSGSKYSSDGATWTSADFKMQFRLMAVDPACHYEYFWLEGALYAVSLYEDGAASKVFINGDRGTATSATSTTLTCNGKTWGTAKFVSARVRIIAGTGAGQNRKISSHTDTVLTTSAWTITPSTDSKFIIYSTKYWTEVTTTGLGAVKGKPCVAGTIAYFPQGQGVNVRRMRVNASSYDFADDGTNKADLIYLGFDPSTATGAQVWTANNTALTVSRADTVAWGTGLTFRTGIPIGSTDYPITAFGQYNNMLWVFKEDSIWALQNDRAYRPNPDFSVAAAATNGVNVAHNAFLYFSLMHTTLQLYGGQIDPVGPDKDAGIPDGRQGPASALLSVGPLLYMAIDAGTVGTSSVMIYTSGGWHEVLRGFAAGKRIRAMTFHPCPDAHKQLWVDIGGDMVYQEYPQNSFNPLKDDDLPHVHEAVLISSTIDMGAASLPKYMKELSITTKNLEDGVTWVELDYQVDKDVGTDTWARGGEYLESPDASRIMKLGNKFLFRYRLRLMTSDATTPAIFYATTLKGFARTPVKRQFDVRINLSSIRRGNIKTDLRALYDWLWNTCASATGVTLRALYWELDGIQVVFEPPTIFRESRNKFTGAWSGYCILTLREI